MTSTSFGATFTSDWMRRFAASVTATEDELTRLDQQVGDGDFGVNLSVGVQAALRRLPDKPGPQDEAAAPLEAAASAFLDEIGGTSGPLFGLLLQSLATAAAEAGPALTTPALAAGAASGLAAIQRVGEAAVGDRTLVDALAPVADALRTVPAATPPDRALLTAADAAWQGARDTVRIKARLGRSSYLGDRATGIPDPGAVGVSLLFASGVTVVPTLAPHLQEAGH
ncbi:dihydroxyacetone kinase subunit DhaL [Streptomyces zagrosensis]|uniref:Dihydroxyacetone kinase-like protein n=1 Tax=Streptomyces zagrosensis TaxID=1042984 RepID=A0A7W9UYB8_9ACTN|nr:dihydroxyacetone kinase subunit DhaL [Streptomyces zagrosensis]MBB5935492.1 dihydroxyacetone kinase-like protein [Streptomyces zagrosensis]